LVHPGSSIAVKNNRSTRKNRPGETRNGQFPNRNGAAPKNGSLTKPLTKILIAHGSPVLRLGLATLLDSLHGFRICGQTSDVRQARELCARHRPELVVAGLTLRHGDGVGLIKDLRKASRSIRILVLSNRTDALSLQRSFRAGARGYLAAQDDLAEIPRALTQIGAGELYTSPSVSRLLLRVVVEGGFKASDAESDLSDRELQIFALIGRGLGASRLAKELHLSVKTVETHRMRIKEKLGIKDGAELNRRAETWLMNQTRRRGWIC
jgi:DNA-binding NarL/FixJ family response regulator